MLITAQDLIVSTRAHLTVERQQYPSIWVMKGSRSVVYTYTYMDCDVREASFSSIHNNTKKNSLLLPRTVATRY